MIQFLVYHFIILYVYLNSFHYEKKNVKYFLYFPNTLSELYFFQTNYNLGYIWHKSFMRIKIHELLKHDVDSYKIIELQIINTFLFK